MGAALQDPKQISNTTNPTERDKINATPKTNVVPLEVMWERQFEQEQSLAREKADAVAEAERILFSSTGSINFTEIQVEDKPVIKQEIQSSNFVNYDLFFKPLESAVNIAGSIMNEAPAAASAISSLLTENVLGLEKEQKPVTKDC